MKVAAYVFLFPHRQSHKQINKHPEAKDESMACLKVLDVSTASFADLSQEHDLWKSEMVFWHIHAFEKYSYNA